MELGKQSSNTNIEVGARKGMVDDIFAVAPHPAPHTLHLKTAVTRPQTYPKPQTLGVQISNAQTLNP